jgi:hypothetical protein
MQFVWRNSPPIPSGTPVGYYTFLRMDRSQSMAREIERSPSLFRFLRTKSLRRTGRGGEGGGFSRKQTIVRLRAWREGGFLLQRGERIQKFLPGSKDEHECTDVELLNTPQTAFIGRRSRASMVKPHRVILISSILLDIQRSVRPDRDLGQANDCSFQSMRFKLRVSFRSKPSCHGQNTSVRLPQKGTWTDEACASVSPHDRRRR